MKIQFSVPGTGGNSIIKVIGVGGGGSNAVNSMYRAGIKGVDFVVANTDVQALEKSPIPTKLNLGKIITQGLGCGANPELGRESALESLDEIRNLLGGATKMVFVTAGMGGGTGTGAAPVIARLAREMDLLTVGIVTTPFTFEGQWRMRIAEQGIQEIEQAVDALLVVNNGNLMKICPKNIKQRDAFLMADGVLTNAAKGIAEIITVDGYVNVDFADVRTIMKNSGTALMGTATFAGEDRAQLAVEEALNSPLLDNMDIAGATGILLNMTASEDSLTLDEMETIGDYVSRAAGGNARIIYGNVYDESMGDRLSVTVIATGFTKKERKTTPAAVPFGQLTKDTKPVQTRLNLGLEPEAAPEVTPDKHPPLRPETLESERKLSLEERVQRVQGTDYDLHNPHKLKELEETPAYLRRKLAVEVDEAGLQSRKGGSLSRMSLDDDGTGKFRLRDNNAFLFDNVD